MLRPAHLLLFHHALGDQRIDRRLGKCRGDAKTGAVALAVVDDRTAVRVDVGEELRAKVMKARDRECPFLLRAPNPG